MVQAHIHYATDFYSGACRNSFSRINGIMIQAEQEAHNNFIALSRLIPEHAEVFRRLSELERRHREGFAACGHHLHVTPDLKFAEHFFAGLHHAFQNAAITQQIATCLLIQILGIECFASTLHENYIPVADDFARQVTESTFRDKYSHFNLCESWLKLQFKDIKDELKAANRQVLPTICCMLHHLGSDAQAIGMNPESLIEDFFVQYDETLSQVGFNARDILRMLSCALATNNADSSYNSCRSGVRKIRLCSP